MRVECEGDGELRLACKLSAEDHNLWQTPADNSTAETEEIERAVEEHMRAPAEEDQETPKEEEDITLDEWAQMGYKWFKKDEVIYI